MNKSLRHLNQEAQQSQDAAFTRLEQQLQAVQSTNTTLNAFLRLYPQEISTLRSEKMKDLSESPLFGLSFCVKDNIAIQDQPLTFGLHPPLIQKTERSADITQKLQELGGLLIGSTNLDPACLDCLGQNPFLGDTRNPAYPDLVAGGSSAGSAVAVASNLSDFALGTDFGGSVRIPAAACGVTGISLTSGSVPEEGVCLLDPDLDSIGVLTRTLEDLEYVLDAIFPGKSPDSECDVRSIAIPGQADLDLLPQEIKDSFHKAIEILAAQYEVTDLAPAINIEEVVQARKIMAAQAVHRFSSLYPPDTFKKAPHVLALRALTEDLSPTDRQKSEQVRERLHQVLIDTVLVDGRYLITTTLSGELPRRKELDPERNVNDLPSINRFLVLSNLVGFPSITFPLSSGRSDHDLPLSLQVLGLPGEDVKLVRSAQSIEKSLHEPHFSHK